MRLDVKIYLIFFIISAVLSSDISPVYLKYGECERLVPNGFSPNVVCLNDQPWFDWFRRGFERHEIRINGTTQNAFPLRAFTGFSVSDLQSRSPWLNAFPSDLESDYELYQDSSIELYGYDSHCVAFIKPSGLTQIGSRDALTVKFTATIDYFRYGRLLVGILLYFGTPVIVDNIGLYYASGVSLSVIGGLLILLLIAMRMLPRRTTLLFQGALLIGSGFVSVLVLYLQYLRTLLWNFIVNHAFLVLGYVFITALLSGIVLYWFSLPERLIESFPRTQNIFQFCLRSLGICLIASAPHLPSELVLVTSMINTVASYINFYFGIDRSYVSGFSPLIMRALFTATVVSLCHYVSSHFKGNKRQRIFLSPSKRNNYRLPDLPCATSSPLATRSVWRTPESYEYFSSPPLTTHYGGYAYLPKDYEEPINTLNGHTESYWDGNGLVVSPAQSRNRRGNSSFMSPVRNRNIASRQNRSYVGWMSRDEVVTDDED
ncbi:unnamed protein product [Hymenolepis diminuta]|uniref:Transmembrane protein n=1 Tax=Hymenolepis diminuta TaxID=6216 RepID=A0A0R3SUE9_HYMDI|nr:unnamed protein product [Hymenolepis diminuta]VUZ56418.1 unnamed protein product [Hymenolepis diminuta]